MMEKIELVITGRKVCDVGYRPFLFLNAMRMGIRNFHACNINDGGVEKVAAQLYANEDKINRYIDFARSNHPKLADVGRIEEAAYDGEVMAASEFLQFEQIYKGIPELFSINKKQDILIEKQDLMIERQDSMLEKQDLMIEKQDKTIGVITEIKQDTSAIRSNISALGEDTSDALYEKYEQLSREIAEIKTTLSEIKAKVA